MRYSVEGVAQLNRGLGTYRLFLIEKFYYYIITKLDGGDTK